MTDQQNPGPQPITPQEIARLSKVTKLEEVDFLKVRLLNRNLELLETQAQLIASKQKEAFSLLQEFGGNLVERYSLADVGQVDPGSGSIDRTPLPVVEETNG